ncbi:sensor histidine kinase [Henriciella barbarensis]|uniref:sensor histidine kinase n=1 Tax=Henriciella barbarensis TaxID=86342 RepID=UPI0011C34F37|nr:ATP-binding protein [Henriciella barbarensis]
MSKQNSSFSGQPETVAELRDLYRSAEARAARLRLLVEASRDLSTAEDNTLSDILQQSAMRAAHFAGSREGVVSIDAETAGIPLIAPGTTDQRVGTLHLSELGSLETLADEEDRQALFLLCQLMASSIQRVAKQQENDFLLQTVQERERRLEHVIGNLFSAQEEERRRVSRDLHDSVAQTAGALFRRLEAVPTDEAISVEERDQLISMSQGLIRELRAVIAGLRPTALDDLGLASALKVMSDQMRTEGFDIFVDVKQDVDWPSGLSTAYYRIAQEALANVRKHAGGPCQVDILLKAEPGAGRWTMAIRDHGVGLRKDEASAQLPGEQVGIEMMKERMLAIGGSLTVSDMHGGGVQVRAEIEGIR